MKTLFVASLLAFAAVTASAQTASDSNTVTINGNQLAIVVPSSPYIMHAGEFSKYIGSYDLSNGKSIRLYVRAGTKYAAIDGEAEHILVAKSENSFVAKDRQLAVTIELRENGDVGGEVLMTVPGNKLADGTLQPRLMKAVFH